MRFNRRVSIFAICSICLVLFIYSILKTEAPLSVTEGDEKKLQKSIIELSKHYVHSLSRSLSDVKDGPAAYPDTSYDMKKALAVLLDSMNTEIETLKTRVELLENITNCKPDDHLADNKLVGYAPKDEFIGLIDLVKSKQENCSFPSFDGWPHCNNKIIWMRDMWKSDECYAEWGVDGGDCSIFLYLSENEQFCPPFPWRVNKTIDEKKNRVYEKAKIQSNMNGLFEILQQKDERYKWLRLRSMRMESKWVNAATKLESKLNLSARREMRVLFHMGLLNEENGWNIAKNAFSGGPLGELVQWSDLMSAVYILGHKVSVTANLAELNEIFQPYLAKASTNCPMKDKPFDLIYTDIIGLKVLKSMSKNRFHLFECNVRVIDSFGTEPEYNHKSYSKRKPHLKAGSWGLLELNPKQFYTMFPHTPDNTFLGFVVEEHLSDNVSNNQTFVKENIALVYGKRDVFWKDKKDYISAIHDYIDIHSTIDSTSKLEYVPEYVINHGVLPGEELHALLRKTKIFVGMGFPYEGPAPLEAIANGAVFLNPVFRKPLNYNAYSGKPTSRKITSQHPYSEMFIGSPFVRNLYMDDLESVRSIVKEVLNGEFKTYLPHEFTCEGMLERLSIYIESQDFCIGNVINVWPPISALTVKVSDTTQSCNEVCYHAGMVCEPSYFPIINRKATFESLGINCSYLYESPSQINEIDYPAYLNNKCFLQTENLLFSCAGRYTEFHRICPCRDYIRGQIALCKDCLN